MSGFRRHIMAMLALGQYIEGKSTLINGSFPFNMRVQNNYQRSYLAQTDSNGAWRVKIDKDDLITSLEGTFSSITHLTEITFKCNLTNCTILAYAFYNCTNVVKIDMSHKPPIGLINLQNSFRGCNYLTKIIGIEKFGYSSNIINVSGCFREAFSLEYINNYLDLSHLSLSNTTSASLLFGCLASAATNWYNTTGHRTYWQLQKLKLPNMLNDTDISNMFSFMYGLTDVECGEIGVVTGNLSFAHSPLTLQSAINILSSLQDLQGGTATISFSSYTSALIQADTDAMNLVAQAQSYGWTITFN